MPIWSRRSPTADLALALRAAAAAFAAAISVAAGDSAHAQERLQAHYTIRMTGVSIGRGELQAEIGPDSYTASASGSASGVMSVLLHGKGSAAARGSIRNGALLAESFASKSTEDDEEVALRMILANGAVKELVAQEPPKGERVPLTEEHRHGVLDPVSALLVPPAAADDVLAPATCDRTLPIFDGLRRYNLVLSFKRMDKVKAEEGYAGPVLVCGVVIQPIAGHRPDSLLLKYVAGRRDMELWLAPVGGARVAAPFRISLPTMVGTMDVRAVDFVTAAGSAATDAKP